MTTINKNSGVSRRNFLKTAAKLTGGAAVVVAEIAAQTKRGLDKPVLLAQNKRPQPALAGEVYQTDEQLWAQTQYTPALARNAVVALKSSELAAYDQRSTVEKIKYIQENFPILFRWDSNPDVRREVVATALPADQLSGYEKLPSEDAKVQFCLKNLGVTGSVWGLAPQVRRATMANSGFVMRTYDRMTPEKQNEAFVALMENKVLEANGIHYATRQEVRTRGLAEFALLSIPHPIFGSAAFVTLATRLADKSSEDRAAKTLQMNAEALLASIAKADPSQAPLVGRFPQAQPMDKAAILLRAATAVMANRFWPSPLAEYYTLLEPAYGQGNLRSLDPNNTITINWPAATQAERAEAVLIAVHRLGKTAELLLDDKTADDAWPKMSDMLGLQLRDLDGPQIIRRYFGETVAGQTMDNATKTRLMHAGAVCDAAWKIYFVSTFPN